VKGQYVVVTAIGEACVLLFSL